MRPALLAGAALAAGGAGASQSFLAIGPAIQKVLKQLETPLPPPARPKGEELKVIKAGSFEDAEGKVSATGGVEIAYRGYDLKADSIIGDKATEVFRLEGKASIVGEGAEIKGQVIEVDFRRNVFRFVSSRAKIPPSQLGGEVKGPVFVEGDGGLGTAKEIRVSNGGITTCDLDSPHFKLKARETMIVPEKYAKLTDVQIQVFGTTILRVPMLIIPLTRDAQRYWPEFGQSPDEGYYLKAKFATPLRGNDYLDHKLDLMEKKGVGLGTDWVYEKGALMSGRASAYVLNGPSPSTQLGLDHRQALGRGELSMSGQYSQSNYLTSPQNTLTSARAQYIVPWGGGQSRFGYQRTENSTLGFKSLSDGWTLGDTRRWGTSLSTTLDLNLAGTKSQSGSFLSDTQRLDVRFTGTGTFRAFDAELQYQRAVPVKGESRFLSAGDRTPLLTVRSTTEKLFGRGPAQTLPFNFEASVGELFDTTNPKGITRITLGTDARKSVGQGPLTAQLSSRFLQGLYSDDTAQYVLNYDAAVRWGFARDSSFNVSYRNLRSFGFTPLAIDQTGRNDAFSLDLSWKPLKSVLLSGATGYDVLQSSRGFVPWQSASLRAEWTPDSLTRVRASSFYDTFSQVWSSFQLDADFRVQGARFVVGARYDGRRQQLAGASLTAANMRWGRLGTSVVLDYNGFTQMIEAVQAQLIYDLHCTEAVLEIVDNRVGFRAGRQIGFSIRLKAFPSFSPFGVGRRGQAIGGGTGIGFGG